MVKKSEKQIAEEIINFIASYGPEDIRYVMLNEEEWHGATVLMGRLLYDLCKKYGIESLDFKNFKPQKKQVWKEIIIWKDKRLP